MDTAYPATLGTGCLVYQLKCNHRVAVIVQTKIHVNREMLGCVGVDGGNIVPLSPAWAPTGRLSVGQHVVLKPLTGQCSVERRFATRGGTSPP